MNDDRLRSALDEFGMSGIELDELLPSVRALAEFSVQPSPLETDVLVAALIRRVRPPSEVRLAVHRRHRSWAGRLASTACLIASQAAVIHRGFWIGSAAVGALAALAVAQTSLTSTFVVYMAGPLLAYLGVALGFRAERLRAVEYELACPPTVRQLTLARLALILGYQVAVGLCLSVALSIANKAPLPNTAVLWLGPLLLGVGATLGLSFAMPLVRAATVVYAAWLTLLAVAARTGVDTTLTSTSTVLLTAIAGGLAIAVTIVLLPRLVPAMLARAEPS